MIGDGRGGGTAGASRGSAGVVGNDSSAGGSATGSPLGEVSSTYVARAAAPASPLRCGAWSSPSCSSPAPTLSSAASISSGEGAPTDTLVCEALSVISIGTRDTVA